jgi:hypothetical protein
MVRSCDGAVPWFTRTTRAQRTRYNCPTVSFAAVFFGELGILRIVPAEVIDETKRSILLFAWNSHVFVFAHVAIACPANAKGRCDRVPSGQ